MLDHSGTTLPGVSISIEGSKGGIVSDVEGRFRLRVKPSEKKVTLRFSYVGASRLNT